MVAVAVVVVSGPMAARKVVEVGVPAVLTLFKEKQRFTLTENKSAR